MPAASLPDDLRHEFANVNGIRMHYAEAGAGDPVLFLHGFPEMWYSWRHQLEAFAPGYRVIAPDLRGYNETDARPPYDVGILLDDLRALLAHLGTPRASQTADKGLTCRGEELRQNQAGKMPAAAK